MAEKLPDATYRLDPAKRARVNPEFDADAVERLMHHQPDKTLCIREYEPADAAAVRACVIELQDAERSIDPRLRPGHDMVDEYVRGMHDRARDHAGTLLVAELDGEVVGLVLVLTRVPFESLDEPPGDYALVAELVVREHMRGRNSGKALLDAAENHARQAGASELRISVLSGNTPARRLYLARGFESYLETLSKRLSREES